MALASRLQEATRNRVGYRTGDRLVRGQNASRSIHTGLSSGGGGTAVVDDHGLYCTGFPSV
jgi:hypothetical protein